MKTIKFLLLSILSILTFSIHAQENLCFDGLKGSWWPIEPGLEFKYAVGNENKTSVMLNDSVQFKGQYYLIKEETILKMAGQPKMVKFKSTQRILKN